MPKDHIFEVPESLGPLDRLVSQEILDGQSYPAPPLADGIEIRCIVDIGACIGAAACWFHSLWPNAFIQCWEPNPEAVKILHKNAPFADIYGCAVTGSLRQMKLVGPLNQKMAITRLVDGKDDGHSQMADMIVGHRLFDRLKLPADVVKIDTEGMEVEILDSIRHHLTQVHVVYVESHSKLDTQRITTLLTGLNFIPFCVGGFWPVMEMAFINVRSAQSVRRSDGLGVTA